MRWTRHRGRVGSTACHDENISSSSSKPRRDRTSTIFFVVLAFFLNTGFVCPPNPLCFRSYRRFPWAYSEALPVLYCVTLCIWWFLHFLPLQKAFFVLGTFTIPPRPDRQTLRRTLAARGGSGAGRGRGEGGEGGHRHRHSTAPGSG